MQILPFVGAQRNTALGVNFLGPIVHHFTRPSCIAMAADQTTCLQLVGRNLVRGDSEMKNRVERGLPLPSIWPIHLSNRY